jgi:uncharacterized tellurite resistance protein B-like protein
METKKKNAAHICNLIQMAMRDFDFDNREKHVIIKIASRLGLSAADFENITKEDILTLELPESLSERIAHLYDFVSVMIADGVIHEEEIKYIAAFTKAYGFEPEMTESILKVKCSEIRNTLPFRRFLDEFRKTTAEELSSVVVDHDMNIKFPLYETQIENLGPLPKTLYVFFLIQNNPIHIRDLCSHKDLLMNIYMTMLHSKDEAKYRIENLIEPSGVCFNTNRTRINRAILNALPANHEKIIDNYIISGAKNQPKSIKLNKSLVHIQPKVTSL